MSKPTAPSRGFDCVEMKRRIQARICAETRGMSQDELLAYFRRRVAASRFAPFFGLASKTGRAKRVTRRSGGEAMPAPCRGHAQLTRAAPV